MIEGARLDKVTYTALIRHAESGHPPQTGDPGVKAAALAGFPFALYAIGFFEAAELRRAGELVRAALRNRP
jgi:hypothetical protein